MSLPEKFASLSVKPPQPNINDFELARQYTDAVWSITLLKRKIEAYPGLVAKIHAQLTQPCIAQHMNDDARKVMLSWKGITDIRLSSYRSELEVSSPVLNPSKHEKVLTSSRN